MQATVRQLKNQLSEYLRRVQEGEEVTVTSRGRPMARLTAVQASSKPREESLIERLAALPWVRPGRGGKPAGSRKGVALRGSGPTAAELVLEDRE